MDTKKKEIIPLDIKMGSEWAPDELTTVQPLFHNVFIGKDGAVYPLYIKKNIKKVKDYDLSGGKEVFGRILAIKKVNSGAVETLIANEGTDIQIVSKEEFSRFCFVSTFTYGCLNFYYDRELFPDSKLDDQPALKAFEFDCFKFRKNQYTDNKIKVPMDFWRVNIAVDHIHDKIFFPAIYMFQELDADFNKDIYGEYLPRNLIAATLKADAPEAERIQALEFENKEIKRNDICHGAIQLGHRMLYYSMRFNEFRFSKPLEFQKLLSDKKTDPKMLVIKLPYQVHGVEVYNNYVYVFKPDGINRFVIDDSDDLNIIHQDVMFFIEELIRFNANSAKVGTSFLFYTEEGRLYSISGDKDVNTSFQKLIPAGLPSYRPYEKELNKVSPKPTGIMSIEEMNFLFVGNWLINLDNNNTITTYTLDGYKTYDPAFHLYDPQDPGIAGFSCSQGNIICDYSSIGRFMTYKETVQKMLDRAAIKDLSPELPLSFEEGEYNYGKVKHIRVKPYRLDNPFTLTRIAVSLRTDILEEIAVISKESKKSSPSGSGFDVTLYMKLILHEENDDFDPADPNTWGDYSVSLKDISDKKFDTKKPLILFDNIGLSNINSFSLQLTWGTSFPIIIENIKAEILRTIPKQEETQ